MTMKFQSLFIGVFVMLIAVSIASCEGKHPEYLDLGDGHYKKLLALGDDQGNAVISSYFALQVTLFPDSLGNQKGTYLLVHPEELYKYFPHESLLKDINQMKQGEICRYILPGKESLLLFSADSMELVNRVEVEYEVKMEKRFASDDNICEYFMHKAQENMMDEIDAIKLCQSTKNMEWLDYGKISMAWINKTDGDSIKAGDEITIEYNTYWLDGTRKDSLTNMQTAFGKPGQMIPGMQYGISLMRAGERALVYMPSSLAFGEDGSQTGIIPPKTPIYFDINVLEVKKSK
jgi:FKBP-type peptidyl-prolyl cis-trans isomerase